MWWVFWSPWGHKLDSKVVGPKEITAILRESSICRPMKAYVEAEAETERDKGMINGGGS